MRSACLIRPKAIWTIVTHTARADKWRLFAHKAGEHASQDVLSFQAKGEACGMGEFDIPENQNLYLHARYFFLLMHVLGEYEKGNTIASIAKDTGSNWTRIQRWIEKALTIRNWISREYQQAPPCLSSKEKWNGCTGISILGSPASKTSQGPTRAGTRYLTIYRLKCLPYAWRIPDGPQPG